MDRTASLAVVFPLAHVARLFTVGTAAATVEARTTREMKTLENMAKFLEEESAVDVGVFWDSRVVLDAEPSSPPHRFIPSGLTAPLA